MTNITAKVTGASIVASADGKLTSGMVGVSVHIEYDETWAGLKKNVSFKANNFQRTRKDVSSDITVPWEVMRQPNKILYIGVEGRNERGDVVIPTVWTTVGRIEQGANASIVGANIPEYEPGNGGYYIPSVENGVISWTPSKDNMPEAHSAEIFTETVKAELVEAVLAALPDGDEVEY